MTMILIMFLLLALANLVQWRFGSDWRVRLISALPLLGLAAATLIWGRVIPEIPAMQSVWTFAAITLLFFVTSWTAARRLPETPTPPHRVVPWRD